MIPITLFVAFLFAEAYIIDPWFWKRGKSDKPWSTLMYVFLAGLIGLVFGWSTCVLALTSRALFDPILNYSRKKNLCYHPDKKVNIKSDGIQFIIEAIQRRYERFWFRFTCRQEMATRFIWFISGIFILL